MSNPIPQSQTVQSTPAPQKRRARSRQQTTTTEELILPVAEGTEISILGMLLSRDDPQANLLGRALKLGLTRDHFSKPSNATIFTAMQSMNLNGNTVNVLTLKDYLNTHHQLERVGGPAYLVYLMTESCPTPSTLGSLIDQLDQVKFKRQTLRHAITLQTMASNGASPRDIEELIDSLPRSGSYALSPYVATDDGMKLRKGSLLEPLANFSATIISEQIEDDGALDGEQRVFELEVVIKGQPRLIRVPASKFAAMAWPTAMVGAEAVVYPGQEQKMRAGIQLLSRNLRQLTVYTHTGWRKIEDQWSYLHSGGAITPTGTRTDVATRLPDALRPFFLPEPPADPQIPMADEVMAVYKAVLAFMDAFPRFLTIPILGSLFGVVLGSVNYSVYVVGESGTFKSEVTALGQSFFGAGFNSQNFPANWTNDSVNNLLAKMFTAKDAWCVIDDFVTIGQKNYDDKQHAKAEQILRAAANRTGRGRAYTDGSARPSKEPRGLVVSSGETLPNGGSLQNRTVIIPLKKGDVQTTRLTEMQNLAREGKFSGAMSSFIQYVATDYEKIIQSFNEDRLALRDELLKKVDGQASHHTRQPTTLTHLAASWRVWLRSAVARRVMAKEEALALWKAVWATLTQTIEDQKEQQSTQHPADYFLTLLRSALLAGKCHLATVEGNQPETPNRFGWRSGIALGECAGWIDEGLVYLQPETAYKVACSQGQALGEGLPVAQKILFLRLDERGLIAKRDVGRGRQCRVPVIRASAVVITEKALFDDESEICGAL